MTRVAVVARLRNSVLQLAVAKAGNARALSDALGVRQQDVSAWLGLRRMPGTAWRDAHWERVGAALSLVTGRWHDFEGVFPPDLYRAVKNGHVPRSIEKHMDVEPLSLTGISPAALLYGSDPESALVAKEQSLAISRAMENLSPRTQQILTLRLGLDGGDGHTAEETGRLLGISGNRVSQIEIGARRLLRDALRKVKGK